MNNDSYLILTIAVAAIASTVFTTSIAHADLLAEEQFSYVVGENIHDQNGGIGFAGAWNSTISHGQIYKIESTGLSFPQLRSDGNSISRFGASGRAQANRKFSGTAQTALTGDGSTVWFGVLFQAPSQHRYASFLFGNTAFNTDGSPVLAAAGSGFGFTLVAANGTGDGGGKISALAFDNAIAPTVVTSAYNPGTSTSLLVGKINWKADGTPDEFFLFNVTDLSAEPQEASAIASITNLDFDQSTFDTVAMWDTNNAITDEIRFATTFSEAIGTQPDADGDGMPDAFELAHTSPSSAIALEPNDDLEHSGTGDGLTNLQEYQYGTDPNNPDSDGDNLEDGPETIGAGSRPPTNPAESDTDFDGFNDDVETNTGIWVNSADPGTNPASADTDGDGFRDSVETNTGIFVSNTNTGTDPHNADTDSDGAGDWYEITASFTSPFLSVDKPNIPYPLPDPDNFTGATHKPVKVYILSGQSNMLGFGTVNGEGDSSLETIVKRQNKFPDLLDGAGEWTTRKDVRYRGVISDIAKVQLSPGALSGTFGPELGFGYIMGWHKDEPVLILKSSIGNRSLGWDVLPPASPSYVYNNINYAGYGGYGNWAVGENPPTTGSWYAGKEFDRFFTDESEWAHPGAADTNVVDVLDNFATEYPDWADQGFEIAGFVWWQGDKDRYDMGHATRYEQNLVKLIDSLRNYYTARYPGKVVDNAPFVLATLGQTPLDSTNPAEKAILDAQLAVDGESGNYPQYAGNVKTIYAHPLSEGGASNGHYDLRAGTYMLVGDALGRAMAELEDNAQSKTFAEWISGFSVSSESAGFSQDADGDGINNGVENFFGTDPSAFSGGLVAVAASGNAFTFKHPQNATPDPSIITTYRWSKDLTNYHGHGQADIAGTTVNFTTQLDTPSEGTTTVTATITGTATEKLFVKVKVIQP